MFYKVLVYCPHGSYIKGIVQDLRHSFDDIAVNYEKTAGIINIIPSRSLPTAFTACPCQLTKIDILVQEVRINHSTISVEDLIDSLQQSGESESSQPEAAEDSTENPGVQTQEQQHVTFSTVTTDNASTIHWEYTTDSQNEYSGPSISLGDAIQRLTISIGDSPPQPPSDTTKPKSSRTRK